MTTSLFRNSGESQENNEEIIVESDMVFSNPFFGNLKILFHLKFSSVKSDEIFATLINALSNKRPCNRLKNLISS